MTTPPPDFAPPSPVRPGLSTQEVCSQIPRGQIRIMEEKHGDFVRFVNRTEIETLSCAPG